MLKIYQNIVIGINSLGQNTLFNLGQSLQFHGFDLMDKLTMKILVEAGSDGFSFTPEKGKVDEVIVESDFILDFKEPAPMRTPPLNGEKQGDEKDLSNRMDRRYYADRLCQMYEKLALAVKSEWKHASNPDLLREVSKNDWQIKGKKIFIVADISDCASSALIIPMLGALNYLLRSEKIPDIHWNIIGVTGLNEDPVGKIHSYSLLKELEFLNKSPEPVNVKLRTPPIDREIDLKGKNPQLYILDAASRGVAPLKDEEISQLIARYIFLEQFYDAPFINPPDKELYFHSLGIGELIFPLNEIIWKCAETDIRLLEEYFKKQKEFDEEETVNLSGHLLKEIADKEPAKLPNYSQYQWENIEPKMSDFQQDSSLVQQVKDFFMKRQKEHDKKVIELYEESPAKTPYIRDLIENVDKLMKGNFYGFTASRKLIDQASAEIEKALSKIRSWNPQPPDQLEYFEVSRAMQDAVDSNTSFAMIVFAFLFMLIPFDIALYDFLLHRFPSGDVNMFKLLILAGSGILSAAGAYAQKTLMEGTLKEKFIKFADIVQEFHKVHYYRTVKETIETFYLELKHLIIGVDGKEKEQIRKEIRETDSLWSKLNRYHILMEEVKFDPKIDSHRFFDAPLLLNTENEKELDGFFKKFLNRPFRLSDIPGVSKRCSIVFDEINIDLPFWREILDIPEKRYDFFNKMYENRFENIKKNIDNLGLDIWKVIEKLGNEYFKPTAANLDEISSVLVRTDEHHLRTEADIKISERIIFLSGKGKIIKSIEEYAARKLFKAREVDFLMDSLLFFQAKRFIPIYKLGNLDDWKYYENRLTPGEKRQLYINDIFMNAPDVNYTSRTAGREES